MKRTYTDGTVTAFAEFFVGKEVEHTKHFGKRTLFVVGLPAEKLVLERVRTQEVEHVYLGANQCMYADTEPLSAWAALLRTLVTKGLACTWDVPAHLLQAALKALGSLASHRSLVLTVSLKVPKLKDCKNTLVVKLDDADFKATNAGVWCMGAERFMHDSGFTDWSCYRKDQLLGQSF